MVTTHTYQEQKSCSGPKSVHFYGTCITCDVFSAPTQHGHHTIHRTSTLQKQRVRLLLAPAYWPSNAQAPTAASPSLTGVNLNPNYEIKASFYRKSKRSKGPQTPGRITHVVLSNLRLDLSLINVKAQTSFIRRFGIRPPTPATLFKIKYAMQRHCTPFFTAKRQITLTQR